jgi:arylsulfatase A-like enzyme
MDFYPTILDIVSLKDAPGHRHDGESLAPLLRQIGTLQRDVLFWHYPHYQHYQLGGTTPYGAIRQGDFKLIELFDDMRIELYNLKNDIGEQRNLVAQMPKKAEALRARLHAWRKEVGAQMPTRNPDYDPARPEHDPIAARKKKNAAK